ncbi:MAG: PA14 domain-containing protein [Thermodesulfobacteriota bacterium]
MLEGLSPAPVVTGEVRPGLAVLYFYQLYRHIKEMPVGEEAIAKGVPGPAIPYLDHRFGVGRVFDSGEVQGVGMQLSGLIHFAAPGTYQLLSRSNDGFRLFLDGRLALDDPHVHQDHTSDPVSVRIQEPGWYPVLIQYFQRKGSATLELHWQPPGSAAPVPIPAAAYGH